MLGRVRLHLSDKSATEAFEKTFTILQVIAANMEEENLRASFLDATAVREVFVAIANDAAFAGPS